MLPVSLPLVPALVGYVLAGLAMLFFTIYTVREMETTPTMRALAVLLALVTVWSLAYAGRLVVGPLQTKLLFHYVAYVGIVFTPVAWLVFSLTYTGQSRYLSRGVVVVLSVVPAAGWVAMVTNYRSLFYESASLVALNGSPLLSLTAGPLYWTLIPYLYLLLLIGLVSLLRFALTSDGLYRIQSVLLVVAAVLPLGLHLSFLAGLSPVGYIDITPIAFALSGLLFAFAVFYGRLTEILPVAREAIIETLDDGVVVTDDADRILFANPAARTLLATGESDPVGMPLSECLPVELDDGGTDREFSLDTDAGTKWYLFRQVPFDRRQTASGNIYSFTDITERTRTEQKLRSLQQTSNELMMAESVEEVGDIVVSAAENILALPITGLWEFDPETERLDPVTMTAAGTRTIGDQPSFSPDDSLAWGTFTGDRIQVFEDVTDHPDVYRPDTPIRSEIQVPLGDSGLLVSGATERREFDDVTLELVRILATAAEFALVQTDREVQLRQRERELARENERLNEFTSVVSHDLRSPLNSADIFLDRLTDEYDDDRLDKVESAHDRTKELVDDLLALARQGKAVEDREPVAIDSVSQRAWGSVRTQRATLTVTDDCGTVRADESRLRQLMENLFANSVEHGLTASTQGTREDSATNGVGVRVGLLDDGDGFYVADDGPGIPATERSQVFEHGYTQSEHGTGFGLAIVRRIVDAHGWSVRATESADGGLRIEVHDTDASATAADERQGD